MAASMSYKQDNYSHCFLYKPNNLMLSTTNMASKDFLIEISC